MELKKLLGKDNELFKKIKHTGYKRYFTHFNFSRPYLVYLGKKDAYIYEEAQMIKKLIGVLIVKKVIMIINGCM